MRGRALVGAALALVALVGCGGHPEPTRSVPPLVDRVRQWQNQGQRLLGQGEWEMAKSAFDEARQLAERLDDLPGVVEALNGLGAIAVQERRAEEAVRLHRRAVALAEETRRPSLLVLSVTRLASALHAAGRTGEAQEHYQRALHLARAAGDKKQEAIVLNNLGLLDLKAGVLDEARTKFEAARTVNQALNETREWSANLVNLGLVAEAEGRFDDAQRQFETALELDKAGEQQVAIAGDLAALARLSDKRGDKLAALSYYQRAYWSYRSLDDGPRAREALTRAIALAHELHKREQARDLERELSELSPTADRP